MPFFEMNYKDKILRRFAWQQFSFVGMLAHLLDSLPLLFLTGPPLPPPPPSPPVLHPGYHG